MLSLARLCSTGIAALMLMLLATAYVQAGSPWDGDWMLNVEKSKFDPGPPPKSQTRTYKTEGEMTTMTIQNVSAEGETTSGKTMYRMDGKDHPVSGSPEIDAVATTKVDDATVRGTTKRAGKVTGDFTRTLSKDGKTMTVAVKGTNPAGQPFKNTLVFDRK